MLGHFATKWTSALSGVRSRGHHTVARTDALTGLLARTPFMEALDAMLTASHETAVIYLDLDGFKCINDSFGHAVGDAFLRAGAERIQQAAGAKTLLARMGGDEFAIALNGPKLRQTADHIMGRIISAMAKPISREGRDLISTASIGIAFAMPLETTADELLRRADMAMYAAKREGGSLAVAFDGRLAEAVERKKQLLDIIHEAVEKALPMPLLYEPLADAASGRMVGVRATLDWPHALGDDLPQKQLAFAANENLGSDLLLHTLNLASRDHCQWDELRLVVPASVQQLLTPGFDKLLEAMLTKAKLNPTRLELEFDTSEHKALHRRPVAQMLTKIASYGVSFSLDGFGRGCTDISLLASGLIERLHIDASLTQALARDSAAQHLLQGIAAISRAHRIKVSAEAAHNDDNARLLRLAGIAELIQPGLRALTALDVRHTLTTAIPVRARA